MPIATHQHTKCQILGAMLVPRMTTRDQKQGVAQFLEIPSEKWKWKSFSHVQLFITPGLYSPWNSLGHNIGVDSLSLLQGIFPTQGLNPGLPHCRQIPYHVSPRILEWVAYPFSSGSSWPRTQTRVSCIAGRFFINWAIKEAWKSPPLPTNNWNTLPTH